MDDIVLQASLDFIIFENASTHYVVGSFSETENYHTFIAAGNMKDPLEDQEYELTGRYIEHPRYGTQFQIQSARKILPRKEYSILHLPYNW